MTPEEKARVDKMSTEELYQILLRDLRKGEAHLLLERALERLSAKGMAKIDGVIDGIRECIKETEKLIDRERE